MCSCQIHPCRKARETLGDSAATVLGSPSYSWRPATLTLSSFKGGFLLGEMYEISTAKVNNSKKQSARENFASL